MPPAPRARRAPSSASKPFPSTSIIDRRRYQEHTREHNHRYAKPHHVPRPVAREPHKLRDQKACEGYHSRHIPPAPPYRRASRRRSLRRRCYLRFALPGFAHRPRRPESRRNPTAFATYTAQSNTKSQSSGCQRCVSAKNTAIPPDPKIATHCSGTAQPAVARSACVVDATAAARSSSTPGPRARARSPTPGAPGPTGSPTSHAPPPKRPERKHPDPDREPEQNPDAKSVKPDRRPRLIEHDRRHKRHQRPKPQIPRRHILQPNPILHADLTAKRGPLSEHRA
jgi:hypothetical protein